MTIPTRLITPMPQELIDRIDDYRFSNRMPSRADTVRRLVEFGLKGSIESESLTPPPDLLPPPVVLAPAPAPEPDLDYTEFLPVTTQLIGSKPWILTEKDAVRELIGRGARAIADEDSTVNVDEETIADIARILPGIELVDAVPRLITQAIRDIRMMQTAERDISE